MKVVDLVRMVATGSLAVALATRPARAEEPCATLLVGPDVPRTWIPAIERLRTEIAALPRSDCQPMTIAVERAGTALRLTGTTADGRRAERSVNQPGALVAIALGLLSTIPSERPPPPSAAPAPPPAPPAPPAAIDVTARPPPPPLPPVAASKPFRLWVGLDGGVRLTAPTNLLVADVEARADLLFGRWLFLTTIRSAVVSCLGQQGIDCDVYNDVSLGLGVGRRFAAGPAAVDLALEPSFVLMHMELDSPSGNEAQSVDGTLGVLRVDASARLDIPMSESWRLTLTVDAGLAPSLLASPTRLPPPPGFTGPVPPFPAWIGGVRLGASGALL